MQPISEAKPQAGAYVLLTGATGFLGQYLLHDLMRDGHRVAVVVRGDARQSAADRIERIMQHWERQEGRPLPRPVVLQGDITRPGLDLAPEARHWAHANCDRMLHCAASLSFHEQNGEPWRTNVDGTQNVVDFCESTGIVDMHYVSTAYVCGRRDDLVKEDELDVGQGFRTDYEKSKFLAEKIVRQAAGLKRLTVYRPVVITGDSRTGYTSAYHGAYLYMKLAAVVAEHIEADENGLRHAPIRWGAKGDMRRNITTVDWNSAVICKLFQNPEAWGRTYHLAPTHPITMDEVMALCAEQFGLTGIEFLGFRNRPEFQLNELERHLWANVAMYGAYNFADPEFDATNLKRFAPEPECPRIDREVGARLIEFARQDRWGKRKPPAMTEPAIRVGDFLRGLIAWNADDRDDAHGEETCVAFNAYGPGGGGFCLVLRDGDLIRVEDGLPRDDQSAVIWTTTVTELVALRDRMESGSATKSAFAKWLGIDRLSASSDEASRGPAVADQRRA